MNRLSIRNADPAQQAGGHDARPPHTAGDALPVSRGAVLRVWLIWIIWLLFLGLPLSDLLETPPAPPRLVLSLAGLALFVAVYAVATWRNARELLAPPPRSEAVPGSQWLCIAACMLLSVGLALVGPGPAWLDAFIFTSAYLSGSQPLRRAVPLVGVLVLLLVASGRLAGYGPDQGVPAVITLAVTAVATGGMVHSLRTGRALHLAREEVTNLAVMNERLRIARDLHDLLGHNLSLIALKSELAGRLIGSAPALAAGEMNDVARVARTTLQEVREAVGAYRQLTLYSELDAARQLLAAAGVACHVELAESLPANLPSAVEVVLAAAVREGVTNVIRHSRARECVIRLARDRELVTAEIVDDGRVVPAAAANQSLPGAAGGTGLRGLAERVAALDGVFDAGARAGGFRLAVSLPLAARTAEPESQLAAVSAPAQGRPALGKGG